ncbi:MAG TPA: hypothetical protein VFP94_02800 [Terriglobales bacterium]|nr:hypothetical protein [Terriglobales bacterium]
MREKLAALVFLLLAAIVGGYAQAPAPPLSAAGVAAVPTGRTPGRKAAPPLQASHVADPQQLDPATEPSPHHGHHILGLPLKWVVVGVAVVLAVITVAAIANNRDYTSVVHPSAPMP